MRRPGTVNNGAIALAHDPFELKCRPFNPSRGLDPRVHVLSAGRRGWPGQARPRGRQAWFNLRGQRSTPPEMTLPAAATLGNRHLDMRLEAGALAQAVVPGAQLGHRRPLDRKGEPAIDLGAEDNFGEAQFGA